MTGFPSFRPSTSRELLDYYYAKYDADIASGKYEPIVFPWCGAPAAAVVLYLLIPHQKSHFLQQARYLVFAFIVGFTVYQITFCSTRNMAPCYGNGVVSAWLVISSIANLIFNDAQSDFQRIVYKDPHPQENRILHQENNQNPGSINPSKEPLREVGKDGTQPSSSRRHRSFAWQPYPLDSFKDRLQWVIDLTGNTRGSNWSWRTRTIAPPPKFVREQLRENSGPQSSTERAHAGVTESYPTRRELLLANLRTLAISYLCLDLAKGIMARDPYFWGYPELPPPAYLPSFISSSAVLLRAYRLYVTLFGVRYALEAVYTFSPLFFAGIASPFVGAWAEPWMFPPTFGSSINVVERGLAGTWADWWHQTFRFGLEAPSKWFITAIGMNRQSIPAKLIQVFTAFTLSGFMHACGSATQAGPTTPLHPFLFFMTQGIGCVVEDALTKLARRAGLHKRVPKPVRICFTIAYLHVWGYYTGPLMADDMARGGIWLTDPVPFSPLRALGLGPPGDDRWLPWGGWPWKGQWAYFHRGSTWWKSGIAF
ncbi:uncharacterized protein BDZ99DRAFT_569508 [Mytilinidion resinicola]|uniref:Wax synthase domain-containing protein n=1 Tax=Mytilinidion resinicola TaxID=574789 RepID=A0A6A6YSH5_9PEZI|nr:uncharacterized protein BDZ99DRAFT_569508 [Mytilinidion resinicola]KAF2811459.1 hypothetical protein BDZ99DRAFT_569508 [Mytilinidion resinicola]